MAPGPPPTGCRPWTLTEKARNSWFQTDTPVPLHRVQPYEQLLHVDSVLGAVTIEPWGANALRVRAVIGAGKVCAWTVCTRAQDGAASCL